MASIEETYKKLTDLEHVLLRPDSYIGSIDQDETNIHIFEDDQIIKKKIQIVPGLYKIVDEIIVNARDHSVNDNSVKVIKINIDQEENRITVYNDGTGIPIKIHKEYDIYVPELIFGHLRSSSNYDDEQKRIVGGRNGYGAKLANICSTEFILETADGKKKYYQEFSNNMRDKQEPEVSKCKKSYTKISFIPDLKYFKISEISDDFVSLLKRRAYDVSASTRKNVTVYFNDQKLSIKTFKDYIKLFLDPEINYVYEEVKETYNWEVCVAYVPDNQFEQVSLVNGIYTSFGGTHVDYIVKQVTKNLEAEIKKKNKDLSIKSNYIKEHIWLFLNCSVENPAFTSQVKECLKTKISKFGSKCNITPEFIKKLMKTGIDKDIIALAQFKENKNLKKQDGKKKMRVKVPKLDDANLAGGRYSSECTLILTEGDSAKALAISGLSVVGRDRYGVYPLKGKLLNVREASSKQTFANDEINNIKKIIGLEHGKEYQDVKNLRYGKVMLMTDADVDGVHIEGLCMNLFDYYWQSLLKQTNFLTSLVTPIVKVTKGKKAHSFYTLQDYETWKETHSTGWTIKYYKGLGTSTSQEGREYFKNLDESIISYRWTPGSENSLKLAFAKGKDPKESKKPKYEDRRKEWLAEYKKDSILDQSSQDVSYPEFVDRSLIHFSNADNVRSIPSLLDGLKPGQRKVMFASFKRNLTKDIKVSQFAGYISETTAYHHGEASLHGTIIGIAQDFVGSNNINLLYPAGQFGTRLKGGKDHASPRYIFTRLENITRILFNKDDEDLLKYLDDDGASIEPEWFLPILPMILINGTKGIGTGYSTNIPSFNPLDIIQNIRRLLENKKQKKIHPWYNNFDGEIKEEKKNHYVCQGKYLRYSPTTIEVTELPIGVWTETYKELLTKFEDEKVHIKSFKNNSSDTKVQFRIDFLNKETLDKLLENVSQFEKNFRLSSTFTLTNMTLFDSEGKLRKYNKVKEIIQEYYELRLEYYQKRKDHLIEILQRKLDILKNKVRFILEQIEDILDIRNKKKDKIFELLEERKYQKISLDLEKKPNYDYLLNMNFWSITREKVEEMKKDQEIKEALLEELGNKSPKDLWNEDLDKFEEEYLKYLECQKKRNETEKKKK